MLSCNQAEKSTEVVNKKLPNGGEVNGPRSVENIETHLSQLKPRFDFFYQKYKKIRPELKGIIELVFEIDSKGNVYYFDIGNSTTKDPEFEDEILHALSNHKFGAWAGGKGATEVIYPLQFGMEENLDNSEQEE
jgi:hypothetical protein